MPTAREAFDLLRNARVEHTYRACNFGGSGTYLAIDHQGRPTLFLRAQDRRVPWSKRTESVSLVLGEEWRIHLASGEVISDRFHALRCEAINESSIDSFLLVADVVTHKFSEQPPSQGEVTELFQGLIQLFRQPREQDVTRGRQGLWAELFLMQEFRDQPRWMRWWHSDPYRRWDFTCGTHHIEVKSSTGLSHSHTFAHRQLHAPPLHEIAIVSILLRSDQHGLTLQQLITANRVAIRDDLQLAMKLEKAVHAVHMTDPTDPGPAYAKEEAAQATAWYWAATAPRFAEDEPHGVTNTHYRVDLTTIPTISKTEFDEWLARWD